MKNRKINVGIIGCGNVGSNVAHFLLEKKKNSKLENIILAGIAVKNTNSKNELRQKLEQKFNLRNILHIGKESAEDIINNPEIDIVIELMGGNKAYDYILSALKNKKHVITANKMVIADYGDVLFEEARKNAVGLGIEASVCGAIPIIKLLSSYYNYGINSISGILNGTTNYILTQMKNGMGYKRALKLAQEKGFAEKDPSDDVSGNDARYKLSILASIAFQSLIKPKQISISTEGTEGIARGEIPLIDILDIAYNNHEGFDVKFIAQAKRTKDGIEAKVYPMLIRSNHEIAKVNYENNTIIVDVERMGKQQLIGKGAGGEPTAYAIIQDLFDIIDTIAEGKEPKLIYPYRRKSFLKITRVGERKSSGYIRSISPEVPGIFKIKSEIFEKQGISIRKMEDLIEGKIFEDIVGTETPDIAYIYPTTEEKIDSALKEMKMHKKIKSILYIRKFEE